jgi:hypothetical protein
MSKVAKKKTESTKQGARPTLTLVTAKPDTTPAQDLRLEALREVERAMVASQVMCIPPRTLDGDEWVVDAAAHGEMVLALRRAHRTLMTLRGEIDDIVRAGRR